MHGLAFVFINYVQALSLGHIGWGFSLDDGERFYFGSTDHLYRHRKWNLIEIAKYMHVPPEKDNDWWVQSGSLDEMLQTMASGRHHLRYHAYKTIAVKDVLPEPAKEMADSMRCAGWNVARNNCIHQSYAVLSAYGAQLPRPDFPFLNRIPRCWFDAIPAIKHNF